MKILIAPDKFKGSLSAQEVCNAVEQGILNISPNTEVIKLPLADGGEGSLVALESAIGFERKYLIVNNPVFNSIETWYGVKGKLAFIEMANASGLQLLNESEQDPSETTSFGTGELIVDALKNGCDQIYLFIGGSATNDAAIGIASALGYKFYDSNDIELKPIGKNLRVIDSLEKSSTIEYNNVEFKVLTDVQNPFFGENGAAYIYAKQKGADEKTINDLDNGLRNISGKFSKILGKNISEIPGSGAAGGIGGGMVALFDAEIKSGIEAIFEMLNFDSLVKESDFIITGEGKFDSQTLEGKVVKGVIDKCEVFNKRLGILCGKSTLSQKDTKYINAIVKPIMNSNITENDSMQNAAQLIVERSKELFLEMT